MGGRAASGALKGAGAGALAGASLGPVGALVGGLGGAVIGFGSGLDEESQLERDEKRALKQQELDERNARIARAQEFMMQHAGRNGASRELMATQMYNQGMDSLGRNAAAGRQNIIDQADAAREFDPSSLGVFAQGAAVGANKAYDYYNKPVTVDIGTSPEVQSEFDAENLAPLRKGRRLGWGDM